MEPPPLAGEDPLPPPAAAVRPSPPSSPTLEIRLFYVRVTPCAPDAVPPHLTLSHKPSASAAALEINGPKTPSSVTSSLSLRRDRVDRDAAEVTYVSTDSVRFSAAVDLQISDDRGNLILSGSLDRSTDSASAGGPVQHQAPSAPDKDPKTRWTMDCSTASAIASSAFVQPELGIKAPSFEVYVAGCSAGSPLILTQTVHHTPPRKAARTGNVDAVPEDNDAEGSRRRKALSASSSMDDGDGDGDMDLTQIQRAGLSVVVACTTLLLELLRRKEIIWPKEPSMCRDMRRNANMQRIIGGGQDSCTDFLRMDQPAFYKLVDLLKQRSLLRDTIHVSVEEQVAMFLHTVGHSSTNRAVKNGFNRSGETISRYFNRVLGAICSIRNEFIKQPGHETHPDITNNPSYYPWFKDCIGLVGATHIEATVPAEAISHIRGRKDRPSQNVVAVVTPNKRFCCVLAGWEGSTDDFRTLRDALSMPPSNEGKYYLADDSFKAMPGFIAPYRSEQYYHHTEQPGFIPRSSRELFNLCHSSLCSKVASAFGILKNRFKILSSHPSFPFPTLVDIVLACCVIHNYILGVDPNDKFLNEEIEDEKEQDFQLDVKIQPEQTEETRQWLDLRDKIAEDMWLDHNRYL